MIGWILINIAIIAYNILLEHDFYFGYKFVLTKKMIYVRYVLSAAVSVIFYEISTKKQLPLILDVLANFLIPFLYLWLNLLIIEAIKLAVSDRMTAKEVEEKFVLKKIALYFFSFMLALGCIGSALIRLFK